jgi:hypothetical protein
MIRRLGVQGIQAIEMMPMNRRRFILCSNWARRREIEWRLKRDAVDATS